VAEQKLEGLSSQVKGEAARLKQTAADHVEQGQQSAESHLASFSSQAQGKAGELQDRVAAVKHDAATTLLGAADQAADTLNTGLQTASNAVKSATASAAASATHAYVRTQTFIDTGIAHYKQAEDQVFEWLKDGVETALVHQNTSMAVLAGLTAVALPGPRRFLLRQTIGRLRSEQSQFLSAQHRAQQLNESVQGQAAEALKLQERMASAEQQYLEGLHKVKATNSELQRLAKQVASCERNAQSLIRDLRELPSRQALALRAEVANRAAEAKSQRRQLEKQIYAITKQGL
jgi:hypothetical protein